MYTEDRTTLLRFRLMCLCYITDSLSLSPDKPLTDKLNAFLRLSLVVDCYSMRRQNNGLGKLDTALAFGLELELDIQ